MVLAGSPITAESRCGVAPKTVKAADGAPANAAVIGRPVSANSCSQPSRSARSSVRSLPTRSAPARSAPNIVRSELVVCCATFRLSELAPHSLNAVLGRARELQPRERRHRRARRRIEPSL